ncbi:alpha-ketoglutarate decarboxylase [Flavivirga rizhaonensis]|uniref:Alpha-ketoglutarate decarboxylase n=1 Tax=Flavivirga rizhaonensis TaxID=2559571 RepID=A0A4S1DXU6_9FLAO|nr:alpha-ketoglutarate decarboxylase [Flavivirga rizhaonensis]TGV02352.1 alpha-ketoglutarate decarboxylase [Flavivirga rizhaonensis]
MKTLLTINKKIALIILVFSFSLNHIIAQQKTNYFWNHVRFGGGIGLNFGNDFFSGTLAPSAIYEFDKTFALGLGLNGTFDSQKRVYKSTILGGSLIGLFNIINEIQLSAEFEQLHVNRRYNTNLNIPNDNYWSPALFLGAGYRSGNVTFGVRYDILFDDNKSIYIDPWAPFVRFYF